MSRNSRNPFSKVEIGTVFSVSSTAAFSINTDSNGVDRKEWHNSPLSKPIECYFIGTRTVYNGDLVSRYTEVDPNTNHAYRYPGSGILVNRSARHAAMFMPVSGVQYRAPLMALVNKCAMDGCDAPIIGHTCCPTCAEFLDPVDKPAYHDDSGDFLEPSDFMLEELEMDHDAMDRIFGKPEVAWFNLPDVIESWDDDQAWKEAWEYGYLVGYEDLPYRPLDCADYQQGPYDYSYGWKTPMHNGFKSGLWQGEVDRKAGKPADWTIYIPF